MASDAAEMIFSCVLDETTVFGCIALYVSCAEKNVFFFMFFLYVGRRRQRRRLEGDHQAEESLKTVELRVQVVF